MANDSPLRDPDLRNDFEHFDERVELWFATSEHRNFLGRMIGIAALSVGMATSDRFQQFDPLTAVATFWDHSVELNRVMEEVNRILPLAQAEARKPRWDEPPAPESPAQGTDGAE